MLNQSLDTVAVERVAEPVSPPAPDLIDPASLTSEALLPLAESLTDSPPASPSKVSKAEIRRSLWASTLDGVFATIFGNITGGVLLTNLLVQLHASAVEIGMLSSIPMIANLMQPLGAYLGNRTTSRHHYGLWIFGASRLLWLPLVSGILAMHWSSITPHLLVQGTLAIVFLTHILGALGAASWLSWVAVLVPRRLRGRYFGFRNSASSLTCLLAVPLLGILLSHWPGGALQGYGVLLFLGVIAGIISLSFQFFMVDVNPQDYRSPRASSDPCETAEATIEKPHWLMDTNFLMFLLYFSFLMFSANLSAPFFNIYLLNNLHLDISYVTIYSSLAAAANLVLMLFWGKLADQVGNRPILILVGILVAITPVLWLGTDASTLSLWLWFPLLHILGGGTWAAMDLCNNNLQIEVAPVEHHATYFAIVAAVGGVAGAIGTTAGGFLAEFSASGGLLGLFALSSVLRLIALLPLLLVREQHPHPLAHSLQVLWHRFVNLFRTLSPKPQ